MKFIFKYYILIFCSIAACKSVDKNKFDGTVQDISTIKLISNPESYNKKNIRTQGYLTLGFEGKVLYVNKEDFDNDLINNGIWLEISKKQIDSANYQHCNKKYVVIEGVFDKDNKGHMNMYSGAIKNIARIEVLNRPPVIR